MRTSTAVVLVIAVIIVAGGAWWFLGQPSATIQNNLITNPAQDAGSAASSGQPQEPTSTTTPAGPVVVHYNGNSFSPASITIPKGGTVEWVNDSTGGMWIASAPHPTHTGYDGTSESTHCAPGYAGPAPFDECSGASTFTFTFDKTGSWVYHNHFNSGVQGTVVVE